MMTRILFGINAALFSGIGLAFIVAAERLGRDLGIAPLSPQGLTDFRATHGGMCLAIGGFFALATAGRVSAAAALPASLLLYLGLGLTRLGGMVADDSFTPQMLGFLGVEAVLALWSAVAKVKW